VALDEGVVEVHAQGVLAVDLQVALLRRIRLQRAQPILAMGQGRDGTGPAAQVEVGTSLI
jgi:hypothetical protein